MTNRHHPIPPHLAVVLAFLNTIDVELGMDDLSAGPQALASWLTGVGLLTGPANVTREQHQLALTLRAGLRAIALSNNGEPPDEAALQDAREALRQLPLVAQPAVDGTAVLVPSSQQPVLSALSRLSAGYLLGTATGQWRRIRRCPAEGCAWVFWDSSAKGTRRWCSMRVCGNRAKARAYAERRQRSRTADFRGERTRTWRDRRQGAGPEAGR